ncbi:MAG: hypothetical protein JW904_08015 [Spirochaetales bacterium]|nr:hypothetical protein [Spirochaetales bacterium]
MNRKGLANAKRLFQNKKYSEVIRILEPQVFTYRESFVFYKLLGLSCLYTKDRGGAYSFLKRAHDLKDTDIAVLLGIAAIHFSKHNYDDALNTWLRVKELDPKNRQATKGLELIRKGLHEQDLAEFIESGKLFQLYPPVSVRFPLFGILSAVVICAIIGVGVLIIIKIADAQKPPDRPEIDKVQIPAGTAFVDLDAVEHFQFTEQQAQEIFEHAKKLFLEYRDNLATVELNRLIFSNASLTLKEYARRLKSYAKTPGFSDFENFRDNFGYAEVSQNSYLYDGCFVLWRGTVANLDITPEKISFRFLKGSYDNKVFEGSIPVEFYHADKFENDYFIELLGKVVYNGESFMLQGVLMHRIHGK